MAELTSSQEQGRFLRALAVHLLAHPRLTPVYVAPGNEVQVSWTGRVGPLLAWLQSAGVSQVWVRLFDDYAAVHAPTATIGGYRVHLWGSVTGLQRLLVQGGPADPDDGLRLSVAELAYFALHDQLPDRAQLAAFLGDTDHQGVQR